MAAPRISMVMVRPTLSLAINNLGSNYGNQRWYRHFTLQVFQSGFKDDGGNGSVRGANATPFVNVADYNRDGVIDVLLGRAQNADRIGGVGIALGDKAAGTLRLPRKLSPRFNRDASGERS